MALIFAVNQWTQAMKKELIGPLKFHYHIVWRGEKIDWESFNNVAEAESAAKSLAREGEKYSIKQFGETCPRCEQLVKRAVVR